LAIVGTHVNASNKHALNLSRPLVFISQQQWHSHFSFLMYQRSPIWSLVAKLYHMGGMMRGKDNWEWSCVQKRRCKERRRGKGSKWSHEGTKYPPDKQNLLMPEQ
jgi:hypothetical protein